MKVQVADDRARRVWGVVRASLRSFARAAKAVAVVGVGVVTVGLAAWGASIARGQGPATGRTAAPPVEHSTASAGQSVHDAAAPATHPGAPGPAVRPSVLGEAGVLLLRNGETVEGIITPAGDFYYVTLPDGQMRFRAAEVRMVCRDLEDAYWRQRGALRADDVMDRLRLVHWCLTHHMPGHAARELADAIASDPTHPGIDYLRRRLRAQLDAASGSEVSEAPLESLGVSPEELDRFVAGLPRGAVESYVATIQPMLQNDCTAAGCHGAQSESTFRLMRAPADRPASRRLTQRNLYAVSRWIDFDAPESSPLLAAARSIHGGGAAPVFGPRRREQYDRLAEWVFELAGRPAGSVAGGAAAGGAAPVTPNPWLASPRAPGAMGNGSPSAAETVVHPPAARGAVVPAHCEETAGVSSAPGTSGVAPAGYFEPIDAGGKARASHSTMNPATLRRAAEPVASQPRTTPVANEGSISPAGDPAGRRPGGLPRYLPADPFDPAIFNQRYFSPSNENRADR